MRYRQSCCLIQRAQCAGEQEGHGAKVYVLRSLLSSKLRNFTKSVPAQLNQSLAMVIMSIITLAGGKTSEGGLAWYTCAFPNLDNLQHLLPDAD